MPAWLDKEEQRRLVTACLGWAEAGGGFRTPRTPNGSSMSVGIVCL